MHNEIVTITPNPAIDRSLIIPNYTIGSIHRPLEEIDLAGGKGLNVARTIKRLGGKVRACILLSGYNGQRIEHLLKEEDIPTEIVWGDGETRTCISVIDTKNNKLTEIYPAGPKITDEIWDTFETTVKKILKKDKWVTISGSLPSGAPPDSYSRLLNITKSDSRILPYRHSW
jgi:fructose-1-phosphate kinase PfkB-like protein